MGIATLILFFTLILKPNSFSKINMENTYPNPWLSFDRKKMLSSMNCKCD
jgi:hypothetical protein